MRTGADLSLRADLTLTAPADAKRWPVAQSQEIVRIPHAMWSNAPIQFDAGAFVDVLIPISCFVTQSLASPHTPAPPNLDRRARIVDCTHTVSMVGRHSRPGRYRVNIGPYVASAASRSRSG